jgi:hypothetical protein
MTGETLHKTGVTVSATMATSHIRIDTVIKAGDGSLGENRFREDFSYLHKYPSLDADLK